MGVPTAIAFAFGRRKTWMPTEPVRGLKAHGTSPAKTTFAKFYTRPKPVWRAGMFSPDSPARKRGSSAPRTVSAALDARFRGHDGGYTGAER